jgi:hypothetical protein
MEDFKMKYGEVNGELVEATERGERATCRECQTELYARLRPHSGHEFTWVHFVAGDCSLSYDREYSGGNAKSTSSNVEQVSTGGVRLAAAPAGISPLSDEYIFQKKRQEIRESGGLSKASECIFLAVKIKPHTSIPGIVGGIKKDLINYGDVTETELIELNAMTTKSFYLECHRLYA